MDQSLVMAYELGNEPNYYSPVFRPTDWNASDYGSEMDSWIPRLQKRSATDSEWMFGAFAGPPNLFDDALNIANMVGLNIPQSISGVKYFSTHGYPYDICSSESTDQPRRFLSC